MVYFDPYCSPLYEMTAPGWALADALPYLEDVPADLQSDVARLVEEAMQDIRSGGENDTNMSNGSATASSPLDRYSSCLPPFPPTPLLDAAQAATKTPLDTTRYSCPPPPDSQTSDLSSWRDASTNAQAQLEHSSNRLTNLELMTKFAAQEWSQHISTALKQKRSLSLEVSKIAEYVDGVNKKRKMQQVTAGNEMRALHQQHEDLTNKNLGLHRAIHCLTNDVASAVSRCQELGVSVPDEDVAMRD